MREGIKAVLILFLAFLLILLGLQFGGLNDAGQTFGWILCGMLFILCTWGILKFDQEREKISQENMVDNQRKECAYNSAERVRRWKRRGCRYGKN